MKTLWTHPRLATFTLLLTAFLGGMVTGVSRTNAAVEDYTAYVNPGPSAAYSQLNCLWHGTITGCGVTPNDGQALDWQNFEGVEVYFRTWAYKTGGLGFAYNAISAQDNSSCLRVGVGIWDNLEGYRATAYYTHTQLSSSEYFWIYGDNPVTFTWFQVGTTVAPLDDLEFCVSEAAHLHQASHGMVGNAGYNCLCIYGDISRFDHWHHQVWWSQ